MLLFRRLTLLLATLLLAACASHSTQLNNNFEHGKTLFLEKQYAAAFPKLMTAAQNGESDAEYAVGYMYYYGQGAAKNRSVGQQWITKAAQNGNLTAKKALEIIQQDNIAQPAEKLIAPK